LRIVKRRPNLVGDLDDLRQIPTLLVADYGLCRELECARDADPVKLTG